MNALQLFGRFLVISLKKEYAYRFELFMTLLQMLFNVSFTLIFWYTMFQYVPHWRAGAWRNCCFTQQ